MAIRSGPSASPNPSTSRSAISVSRPATLSASSDSSARVEALSRCWPPGPLDLLADHRARRSRCAMISSRSMFHVLHQVETSVLGGRQGIDMPVGWGAGGVQSAVAQCTFEYEAEALWHALAAEVTRVHPNLRSVGAQIVESHRGQQLDHLLYVTVALSRCAQPVAN